MEPISRSASFALDLPCADALALFTAAGERAWAPGWDPILLSGDADRGSAFATRSPAGTRTTWIVCDFDPERSRVSYARFAEGSHVGLVDVALTPRRSGCEVAVRYTLTPTTPDGERQVAELLEPEAFAAFVAGWKHAIEAIPGPGSAPE